MFCLQLTNRCLECRRVLLPHQIGRSKSRGCGRGGCGASEVSTVERDAVETLNDLVHEGARVRNTLAAMSTPVTFA